MACKIVWEGGVSVGSCNIGLLTSGLPVIKVYSPGGIRINLINSHVYFEISIVKIKYTKLYFLEIAVF